MLFYRDSSSTGGASSPSRTPRPLQGPVGDDEARHLTWMLKSFVMGITLLGLSYWLVQIAGVQYLATLTSATILSFLLLYVVLCVTQRTRRHIQRGGATERTESGRRVSATSNARSEPETPASERVFDEYTPYKNILRGCSPPPSYEEAVRAMGIDLETLQALQYSPQLPTTSSQPSQEVPPYPDQAVVTILPAASSTSTQNASVTERSPQMDMPQYHDQAVVTIVAATSSTSSQDVSVSRSPPTDVSHYHDQTVITIVPSTSSTSPQGVSEAGDPRTSTQNSSRTTTSQAASSSPLPAVVDNQCGAGVS